MDQIRGFQGSAAIGEPAKSHESDARDYGLGIQILKDLGLSKIRVLTNTPKPTDAFIFDGFDLQVVEQVPISEGKPDRRSRSRTTRRASMVSTKS